MIGGTGGLSTGRGVGAAYGLLHERGPAAAVADLDGAPADVVVAHAGSDAGRAAGALAAVLADGTLGVLVVQRGGRRRALRALRAAALRVRAELVPTPDADRPARLVSLDRDVLVRAGGVRAAPLRVLPPAVVARLRPTALVVEPAVGAGRFGAWLEALVPDADPRRVIAQLTGTGGVVTVWPGRGREPAAFVKLGDVDAEAQALGSLAPAAGAAGARVPLALGRSEGALATSFVGGRRAADVLAERPDQIGEVVGRIAAWLRRWHERTAARRAWAAADTERHLLGPLAALDGLLDPAYGPWLREHAAAFEGETAPFAPAHGDLTLANVLLDGATVGIVDWEEATEDAPPLVDLPYLLADAAAARNRYRDRPAAFAALFGGDGADAALVRSVLAGAAADPRALSLSFHACWLHHAANDVRRDVPGRPFVAIAQALAAAPERLDPFPAAR